MARFFNMLLHVLVLRRVAAAHVTTYQAHAQIWPGVAQGDARLAYVRGWLAHLDEMKVCAWFLFELPGINQLDQPFGHMKLRRLDRLQLNAILILVAEVRFRRVWYGC